MNDLHGKFIVFDGPEGCGKSTQAHMLDHKLREMGYVVELYRDPGSTKIGEEIRHILLNPENQEMGMRCEMLLYMAARAQMIKQYILPALKDKKVVLCDRFVSSTLAYQLGGDGLTADEIRKVADIAIGGRWPDLIFILDMPFEKSVKRITPKFMLPFPEEVQSDIARELTMDRIEQRPAEYHRKVRKNYLAQASADPKIYRVIKADRTPDAVHAEII